MRRGGSVQDVFYRPEMPYTWGLLTSMPRLDRTRQERLQPIAGQPPSLINIPKGCVFNPRCGYSDRVGGQTCFQDHPELRDTVPGHAVRCHLEPEVRRGIWTNEIATKLA